MSVYKKIFVLGATVCALTTTTSYAQDVTIGALFSLSGPNAPYGDIFSSGANLAAEHINADNLLNGKLTIQYEDSQGLPQQGLISEMADLAGAQKLAINIKRIAALARHEQAAWRPTVLLASSSKPESIALLSDEIDRHQAWLGQGERRALLLQQRARYRLRRLIERRAAEVVASQEAYFFELPMIQQLDLALKQITQSG